MCLVTVLGGEANVGEETVGMPPLLQTSIIEEAQIFGNDKGGEGRFLGIARTSAGVLRAHFRLGRGGCAQS